MLLGQGPGRRFEHEPIAGMSVRQNMLDIVGEGPQSRRPDEVDRGRRHHLVLVVDERQHGVLEASRVRPSYDMPAAHLVVGREVLEHRQNGLTQMRRQNVVEILEGVGSGRATPVGDGPSGGGDILPRVQQGQQTIGAFDRLAHLLTQHARE